MHWKSPSRPLGLAALVGGALLFAPQATKPAKPTVAAAPVMPAEVKNALLRNGQASFVVSDITYALGPDASKETCPQGMSLTAPEAFQATPEGRRKEGESDQDYGRRMRTALGAFFGGPGGTQPVCTFPETRGPDPNFHAVVGSNVAVAGIDLDGRDSRSGKAAGNTCSHDDFRGLNGERGIDNQLYRALGCSRGFQSTGGHITFVIELLAGSWGILINLKGVDDLQNDDDVEVGIMASADPIQLDSTRSALTFASYAADKDPRYRARTRGRIVNGVLTTDPVNVRFHWHVNGMAVDRPIDDARLRLKVGKDGSLEGIMAGYATVDELYDYLSGYRSGKDKAGNPSPRNLVAGSAAGSASSAGYSCNGLYFGLKQLADGNRDPKTGKCSSVSTQYRIKAIPAFVVEPPSVSPLASKAN